MCRPFPEQSLRSALNVSFIMISQNLKKRRIHFSKTLKTNRSGYAMGMGKSAENSAKKQPSSSSKSQEAKKSDCVDNGVRVGTHTVSFIRNAQCFNSEPDFLGNVHWDKKWFG